MSGVVLPEGWIETKLGAAIDYGKAAKKELSQVNRDTWILELEDIEKDSSKLIQRVLVADRPFKSTKNSFSKGDILYGKLRPYLNKVIIADTDGVCTTEIIPINGEPLINNRFLFYWLKSESFLSYVNAVSYGVNMPRLGTSDGLAAPFILPPLAEQKVIADKLDSLLAQVDNIKNRLDALPTIIKRFKQSVLSAAVSGKLTNISADFVELTNLSKIGKLIGGKTPSKSNDMFWTNGTISWVSPKDMKVSLIDSSEDKITELAVKEAGMTLIPENSILMVTRSGILAHTFPVALTLKKLTINQDIKAFIPDTTKVNSRYIAIIIKGLEATILNTCSKAGTTVSSIETALLQSIQFRLPPLEEQTEIVRRVEQLFAYADQIEQQVKNAQNRVNNLTQSILAKAFRGELTADWRTANHDLITGENSVQALLAKIKAERDKPKKTSKQQAMFNE